ncbi:MAG: DNA/RNA nuclease SfsA [Bacteroidales bacterium]|nr:DNA/RNA nuclease SfsA [Bacteroidales bacterium]
MIFKAPLISGRLIKRYKRFLADVQLDSGEIITAHCTNSGTMKSCLETNARVMLSPVDDPNRKTRFTWEMIEINQNWVGINTANPNQLAFEAISQNQIPELTNYDSVKREVKYGDSRFDIMAENSEEICYVEVKNVTLKEGNYALFPDAVTTRGTKHLNTLMEAKRAGHRAVMLYIVQRQDVEIFAPAKSIDPNYSKTLIEAFQSGVEVLAYQAIVTEQDITIGKKLPYEF